MTFERIQPPPELSGMVGYIAAEGDVSFVISFDRHNPELGWRASYRRMGTDVTHLPEVFKSKSAAVRALKAAQRSIAQ